jgi:pimeloyl-ACP methyl ester carboxylesterase
MVELPGVGRSLMPEPEQPYLDQAAVGLENIRNLLGIERWQVLSYSTGTRVVERYLQLYPACVKGAIFLCPLQVSTSKGFGLRLAIQFDNRFPQFGNWVLSGMRLKFLIDLLGFNLKKNDLSAKWFAEISSQPVDVLKMTLQSLLVQKGAPFNIPNHLPLCFIWGNEDLLAKPQYRFLSQQYRVLRAVHSAPQTAARQVSEVALPFLLANCGSR